MAQRGRRNDLRRQGAFAEGSCAQLPGGGSVSVRGTMRCSDEIASVEVIVTDSVMEALALENNLIKQRRPKYNILLRDDKNYPYLQLTTSEAFPRILVARHVEKSGDYYAGPFLPAKLARRTMALSHRLFGIRSCNEVITGQRGRPCLEYDIKRCIAPCVAEICGQERYAEAVAETKLLLEGRNDELLESLRSRMTAAAEARAIRRGRTAARRAADGAGAARPAAKGRDTGTRRPRRVRTQGGAERRCAPGVRHAGRPGGREGGAGDRAGRYRATRSGRAAGRAAAVLRRSGSANRGASAAGHRRRRRRRGVVIGARRQESAYLGPEARRQACAGGARHAERRACRTGRGSTRSPRRISMRWKRCAPRSDCPSFRVASSASTSPRSRGAKRWRRWSSAKTAG